MPYLKLVKRKEAPPLPGGDQSIRREMLRDIGHAMRLAGRSPLGPAACGAVWGFITGSALLEVALHSIWKYLAAGVPAALHLVTVGAAMIMAVVRYKGCAYRSWNTKVYALLTSYAPLNRPAYRQLQDRIRVDGLRRDYVNSWIAIERSAVSEFTLARRLNDEEAHARFLRRLP